MKILRCTHEKERNKRVSRDMRCTREKEGSLAPPDPSSNSCDVCLTCLSTHSQTRPKDIHTSHTLGGGYPARDTILTSLGYNILQLRETYFKVICPRPFIYYYVSIMSSTIRMVMLVLIFLYHPGGWNRTSCFPTFYFPTFPPFLF